MFATAASTILLSLCASGALGTRTTEPAPSPVRRADVTPSFPAGIPSCVQCQPAFPGINTCAQAAPVLANFSQVIFNPGAFIDVIKCACTDTFQSAYPQCADCFEQTNQTAVLDNGTDDLSSIVTGLRNVCAVASVILSNVSESNSVSAASASATQSQTTGDASGSTPAAGTSTTKTASSSGGTTTHHSSTASDGSTATGSSSASDTSATSGAHTQWHLPGASALVLLVAAAAALL